jgi:hypothetical protein
MLEFIRCKPIGSIFITKLAGEGFFTASTFDVTGRRRPKAGANLQAQLVGGPVDGGVRHHVAARASQ